MELKGFWESCNGAEVLLNHALNIFGIYTCLFRFVARSVEVSELPWVSTLAQCIHFEVVPGENGDTSVNIHLKERKSPTPKSKSLTLRQMSTLSHRHIKKRHLRSRFACSSLRHKLKGVTQGGTELAGNKRQRDVSCCRSIPLHEIFRFLYALYLLQKGP